MKLHKLVFSLIILGLTLLMSACHYTRPIALSGEDTDSLGGIDSTGFKLTHHYWKGDVFRTDDSLRLYMIDSPVQLQEQAGDADELRVSETLQPDTFMVGRHRKLIVTALANVPDSTQDSTWVFLTSEEGFTGWTKEGELLHNAAPDDPISHYIHTFSKFHTPLNIIGIILTLCVLAFYTYRRKRIEPVLQLQGSPYPITLRMSVSLCALLYAVVWHFAPQTWNEFYFNPTLNPFADGLPPVLAIFLASGWLLALMVVAVMDDVWRRLPPIPAIHFLIELAARCGVISILFSLTTEFIYVGYLMLAVYWGILIHALWRANRRRPYRCGKCGRMMAKVPGRCPHCGAENTPPASETKTHDKA